MSNPTIAELSDRGLVKISGTDCAGFLQNLISCDIFKIEQLGPQYGALLSPQGKLLFDFIVMKSGNSFTFDIHHSLVSDFIQKLTLYKLRANVVIEDLSEAYAIIGLWNIQKVPTVTKTTFSDPRSSDLGYRSIIQRSKLADFISNSDAELDSIATYNQHRINLGIPSGLNDFDYGQVFPHDVNIDYLNGIDFSKGCFVGQEVVSRVRHRGTARRRCVIAYSATEHLIQNSEILADGKKIGIIRSVNKNIAIALIRLDRGKEAFDEKKKFFANEIEVTFRQSICTDFSWPEQH